MPDPADWDAVLAEAKGETVYFHAWGGEPRINDYIAWAGREVEERYGVRVVHVKVSDTAEVVSRVLTEKAAGRDERGAVDLVWINGENFAAMKRQGLLLPAAWSTALPNYRLVDAAAAEASTLRFHRAGRGTRSALGHGEARLLPRYGAAHRSAEIRWRRSPNGSPKIPAASPIRSRRIFSARHS